jgi:hypothetical protein
MFFLAIFTQSCSDSLATNTVVGQPSQAEPEYRELPESFKEYWFTGQAELTSYTLQQERYGEIREGHAVTIFVTEDFLANEQVKADRTFANNIPVLKLNLTKRFITGIYPYNVMTSSFQPLDRKEHAIKVTHSMQEWCGQAYVQLNNRDDYQVESHSYFQGEADQELTLEKAWLESELWNLMRISPQELPTGKISAIPSFEFNRMRHRPIGVYQAVASLRSENDGLVYSLDFPELDHGITWYLESNAPHRITGWDERHPNGMITQARMSKTIRSAYWQKNRNADRVLRDSLGL